MADANSSEGVPSLANLVPAPGVENVARVTPDEDISPGSGKVRKSPGVALADLGDVEDFDRRGKRDQLYAFQFVNGVYKRKEGIISSDGATSMEANLDLGGNKIVNLADPAEPQEAATKSYVDSQEVVTKDYVDSQILDSKTATKDYVDSYFKVHQAYSRIYPPHATQTIWLDIAPGYLRRELILARFPKGKSIYNGLIVILNLWIGYEGHQTGLKKVSDFSIINGLEMYSHFLKHGKEPSARGLVLIQEEAVFPEDVERPEKLSLYHSFNPRLGIDCILQYLELPRVYPSLYYVENLLK